MADCLLALGSNVGDRAAQLDRAVQLLCDHPEVTATAVSRYYQTAPVGGPPGQGVFVNAALRIQTSLGPQQLLDWTLQVERQLGRERGVRWGPRGIDIDLLLYDRLVLQTPELTIPHPRMGVRRFVLVGACEIAADMVHPPTHWTLARLLSRLDQRPYYLAVCSALAARSRQLAVRAASLAGVQLVLSPNPLPQGVDSSPQLADPSRFLDTFGQSLQCHGELLTATLSRVPADAVVLSDYWVPQFLALALRIARCRLARMGLCQPVGAAPVAEGTATAFHAVPGHRW